MPLPPSGQTPTLASYRSEVRFLLHDATGKFWSNDELNGYINSGRFRACSDTGCLRSLVTCNLSYNLEAYPIGGVTGGLITASGSGYNTLTVDVVGDGSGATAKAVLSASTTATLGGQVLQGFATGGSSYTTPPSIAISGDGSGATAICYLGAITGNGAPAVAGILYQVGDVLTANVGTVVNPARFLVTAVNGGGGITYLVQLSAGQYTALPGGFLALTGGNGGGASIAPLNSVGSVVITSPGTGYTHASAALSGGGGSGAFVALAVGAISAGPKGLSRIDVTNPGLGYTEAFFVLTGDGVGAAATPTLIPNNTIDILNVSPIWGNTRIPMSYMSFTEFNAKMRVVIQNPSTPRVWSRYGTSGGAAYLQPPPDQAYVTEFDTAVLPATLVADTDLDTMQYPFTECVKYYAAYRAKFKQQAYAEGEGYLNQYKSQVVQAKASVGMRRIPNPYLGYSGAS